MPHSEAPATRTDGRPLRDTAGHTAPIAQPASAPEDRPAVAFFFLVPGRDLRPQTGHLSFQFRDLLAGLLRFQAPLLAALGHCGDLILEPLDGGSEVLVFLLPAIAALAEGPDQGTGSASIVVARRFPGQFGGGVHANVPLRDGPKFPLSLQRNKRTRIQQPYFAKSRPT